MGNEGLGAPELEQLVDRAAAETGLREYGDDEFNEAISIFIASANESAGLTEAGVAAVEAEMHRVLVNRMRFAEDLRLHPEILEEDVSDPIIVLGMPRTGTTKLQRLMSADPGVQRLDYWRLLNPAPFPGESAGEARIEAAHRAVEATKAMMPNWESSHPIGAWEVDEEVYLQVFTCKSFIQTTNFHTPVYQNWMSTQPLDSTYSYMKQLLRYLQWQDGGRQGRPWILKSPVHMATTDLLVDLFPESTLVYSHRDLFTAFASICRLMQTAWEFFHGTPDLKALGQVVRDTFLADLEKHMALRKSMGDKLDILDIQYEDIRADAMKVVGQIYAKAGREFSEERRQAMLDWEAGNLQHAKGRLEYRLEDYGVTREMIASDCPTYLAEFG